MSTRDYLQMANKDSECPIVSFHDIWHLYSPGMLVYVRDPSILQKVWRTIQATGGRKYLNVRNDDGTPTADESLYIPFKLDCYHLDFDGTHFIRVFHQFEIDQFDDALPVYQLPLTPLSVALRQGVLKLEALEARGLQFLNCTSPQHRYYSGTTLSSHPNGDPLFVQAREDPTSFQRVFDERIDSQVIVDAERAIQANPGWRPSGKSQEPDLFKPEQPDTQDGWQRVEKDYDFDLKASEAFLDAEEKKWQKWYEYITPLECEVC